MAASTLRAAILVAAVAVGVFVIKGAFPRNASESLTVVTPNPTQTRTSSPSPTPTASPSASASPRVKGISVQVLNGTSTTGLASIVTGQLKKAGYTVRVPGNVKSASKTTIYYQKGHQVDAEFLQQQHFPGAVVAPAPSSFSANTNIVVVLGPDFSPPPS